MFTHALLFAQLYDPARIQETDLATLLAASAYPQWHPLSAGTLSGPTQTSSLRAPSKSLVKMNPRVAGPAAVERNFTTLFPIAVHPSGIFRFLGPHIPGLVRPHGIGSGDVSRPAMLMVWQA